MGSRYFITGVQIGIIRALLETYSGVDLPRIMDLLNEIEDKQFIGDMYRIFEKVIKQKEGC